MMLNSVSDRFRYRLKAFEAMTAKVSFADSLAKLQKLNSLSTTEIQKLKDAYGVFERIYKEHVGGSYFFNRKVKEMARNIQKAVDNTPEEIIAGVFAVWSLESCKDVARDKGSKGMPAMMRPLPVQVLAIFRMLGVDQDGWFARFKRKFRGFGSLSHGGGAAELVHNHLVQIKTGEGKSVVLGVLATVLALSGYDVRRTRPPPSSTSSPNIAALAECSVFGPPIELQGASCMMALSFQHTPQYTV